MHITLSIQNNGLSKGSLGWLCANLGSIKIGETKNGKQGAWLKDREGNNITVLAVRGFWESTDPKIETIIRHCDMGVQLAAEMAFTDAAWNIIQQCVEIAVSAMNEPKENAEGIRVQVAA